MMLHSVISLQNAIASQPLSDQGAAIPGSGPQRLFHGNLPESVGRLPVVATQLQTMLDLGQPGIICNKSRCF